MDLPVGNEPLVLADGTCIDQATGKVLKPHSPKFVSVPAPSEAQRIVARTRKTVAELPMPPQNMSAVALVAFYTLYGLDDTQIAIALDNKLSVQQIERVRELEAYTEFMATAKENILNTQQDTVREMFQQHANKAAQKIIDLAESDAEVLAFKASQDVLDRAGHRPADIVEHRHKMDDALHIIVTKRDENDLPPAIDVTPTVIEETTNG